EKEYQILNLTYIFDGPFPTFYRGPLQKINSLDPLNIPLTFFEGDYLQVINNKIYLNSVLAGDYRVVGGSNVFTVDANITTPIYCVTDGDVTATAEIRERFV
uniref:hypothetical protein n=1 Tax=Enterococcus innesii TaxID=2839759 RepID=UPI003D79CE1A